MTSMQNICVPRRDKTGAILRQAHLMENSREMTAVSQTVQEITMKKHVNYSFHYNKKQDCLYRVVMAKRRRWKTAKIKL